MKIRMKMPVAGAFHGMQNVARGDVVDVPDDEGARYCKLGYAEPVVSDPLDAGPVEYAVMPDDAETRAESTAPKKRGRPRTTPKG